MSAREDWVWMPHAGHLCVGSMCRFRLNTYVGGYIVSTVGEYIPDSHVREILANSRGTALSGKGDERLADWMEKCGYEEIGLARTYETMVFKAVPVDEPSCCPWTAANWSEVGFMGANDAETAYRNHMKMCEEFAGAA